MQTIFLRITLYLLLGLLGLSLATLAGGGVLGEVLLLLLCLIPCVYEWKRGLPLPVLRVSRPLSSLLFLPLLLGVTVGLSALSALFLPAASAPTFSFSVFLTSAFFPALSEEILFRYLLLSLLLPLGKRSAVTVSALLFALFHQNFYQMPYAFGAGLVLAAAALYSHSFLLPFLLHVANNTISLAIGHYFTLPLLLATVGIGGGALAVLLCLAKKRKAKEEESTPLSLRSLWPLIPFVVLCLAWAILRILPV